MDINDTNLCRDRGSSASLKPIPLKLFWLLAIRSRKLSENTSTKGEIIAKLVLLADPI